MNEKKVYHSWIDGNAIYYCEIEKRADGYWRVAGTEQLLKRFPTKEETKRVFAIFKNQIGNHHFLKN